MAHRAARSSDLCSALVLSTLVSTAAIRFPMYQCTYWKEHGHDRTSRSSRWPYPLYNHALGGPQKRLSGISCLVLASYCSNSRRKD